MKANSDSAIKFPKIVDLAEWKKARESVTCDDRKQRDDKKDMANPVVKCRALEHDEANGQQGCSPDDQRLPGLRQEHADLGIATEAWSPLAQGEVLDNETITRIADAHEKTPGQVVIRWHLQLGNIVIPKSVTPERIVENFDVFDFRLTEAEMEQIRTLDAGHRTGPDPDTLIRA